MNRDEALDMALGQIEKNYGKGAIMRLGEDDRPKIAAIPTGALSLDVALGVGGLPRGRVTEIYGPESSGKCLVAGTYIWTDRGLETVEELFARVDQPASCASRVTDVAAYGVRLVNEEAGLEPMAAVTHNHRRTVRRVELESGRHVTATLGHPLRVRNERGRIVWRKVENLREGDALVSALFGADEAAAGDWDGLSEDEAVLLGYLVAERSLGPARPSGIGFTDAHDPDVLDEYTSLLESVLGLSADQVVTYADKDHRVHNAARRRPAEEYGLDHVESADKDIPHRVRCGGAKIQRAFLSALFEGDGWIQEGPEIGLTSASRTLVEQTQLLLYGLGIPASLRTRHHDELDRDHHALRISAGAVSRFLELVGFRSERRARQVATHLRDVESTTRAEHPPHLRGPLVDQLHELARPLTFERITAIVEEDPQPTFDVVVPGTHSFLANGMLSHNTTVALHCIAEAQMAGGIAAFIDAEHALDPTYAAALGVDTDALLVSQPDTGEQALEITDMLVRSGAVDIVVIDSVAALTPRAEIEGEMGDSHVGLQARLMSQALRKLAGNLNRSRTSAVFINQLREKIGVMFGCFSYRSRVVLADGTTEKIGKIVNQRMPVKVRTYDPETDSIVNRRVTNWFDNGRTERFLQFTVAKPSGNGRSQFQVTPNHLIRTPGGWREAGELIEGDRVLQSVTKRLSDFQWEVLLGGLMGDGALSPSRSGHAARFRFGHGAAQASYAGWKAGLFENVGVSVSANAKRAMFADVRPLPELAELRRAVYLGGRKFFSEDYVKALTPLSLAVWYMDDGGFVIRSAGKQARTEGGSGRITICVEAMEASTRERLRRHLADTYGITSALSVVADKARLTFSRAATDRFQELVAPFIHPSMEHKLLPRLRGRFAVEPTTVEPEDVIMPLPITEIRWSEPAGRSTHRFDIEVEGTHNYFVDGVMAHNSPETTPGGRALKFYSSVRLDVRRIESLKDGTDAVGNRVRVKVVKNKCVAAGTKVFDPTTGLTHAIEETVDGEQGTAVWAADKSGMLRVRPIRARLNQGRQEVIGLRLRDGTTLRVTPDHRVLTEHGWRQAQELQVGDTVARARTAGTFGSNRPVTVDQARMLGYLIGDGYVGGKTPIAFINTAPMLHEDAARIAATHGCEAHPKGDDLYVHFSHRKGERNGLLELARWAGIWGHLAPQKRIPPAFFVEEIAEDVVANLVFGIFESDGWVSREQTGALRCGFTTTSEQLAHQLHWLLLRWGVGSSMRRAEPGSRRSLINGRAVVSRVPCWEVRISGMDNVQRFAAALPTWGPRGTVLDRELADPARRAHRGSQRGYLPSVTVSPVLDHLAKAGVTAVEAAAMIGDGAGDPRGGMRQVLGVSRLRRDRVQRLAAALESQFLNDVLAEELWYDRITAIIQPELAETYDIEVDELHNFVADGVVVHNCAPPFRQAEFDIMYGLGISKEGSLLDMGVEHGIVKKAGAWYTYDGEQLGQGRENARTFLKEHTDLAEEIRKKITELLGLSPVDVTGDDALAAEIDDE